MDNWKNKYDDVGSFKEGRTVIHLIINGKIILVKLRKYRLPQIINSIT
jgi:hypothetical protein